MNIIQLPTERLRLLFPIRVPGGEIRKVTVRPISDEECAEVKADEDGGRTFEIMARAAGLSEQLGRYLADSDMMRIAHATGRLRVQYCQEGYANL